MLKILQNYFNQFKQFFSYLFEYTFLYNARYARYLGIIIGFNFSIFFLPWLLGDNVHIIISFP